MSKIKMMDEQLANKIAAGEVVERCASVVKELVENSIDAGSTEIKIDLIEAGTKEIKITDNGSGMDKDDAILAFGRHATSKLFTEDDLYHINTLGFRGEALASIASVSVIELMTSTGDIGTNVYLEGGKVIKVTAGEARQGTIITVKDLFYNTPARLKYMKSLYTELASITEFVDKLALSYPNIRFTLTNNNSILLKTDGSGNLLKTIKSIYGIDVTKGMIAVTSENDDYNVSGYISLPELHRSSRNHLITIVNGRVVRNADLNRIINDSYHSYKPDNRYPIVVLMLEVDPSLVDVNIHPTKMDIKFSKMEDLLVLIETMIKKTLKQLTLIPEVTEERQQIDVIKPHYENLGLKLERISEDNEEYTKPIMVNDFFYVNNEAVSETIESDMVKHNDPVKRLPELYPVGLVHGTYIICQNEEGMYLIDQHAAKERINYETFKYQMGSPKVESASLLFPLTIELSNSEFIIFKENMNLLLNMHFDIQEFGLNSIIVKAHPTWLPRGYEEEAIRKIIEVIIHREKDFTIEKFNENIATMLSCKLAIKANENITHEEQEQLINDLRKCDNPFNCPHGRPTIIFYSNYDLEKLFKRSGF